MKKWLLGTILSILFCLLCVNSTWAEYGGEGPYGSAGGQIWNVTTVNASTYDVLVTDHIIHVTYSGAVTVTLPTAQVVRGRVVIVKNSTGNIVTMATEGAETIDGGSFTVSNSDTGSFFSDGSNWFILNYYSS